VRFFGVALGGRESAVGGRVKSGAVSRLRESGVQFARRLRRLAEQNVENDCQGFTPKGLLARGRLVEDYAEAGRVPLS
jgi:hypothetical protein